MNISAKSLLGCEIILIDYYSTMGKEIEAKLTCFTLRSLLLATSLSPNYIDCDRIVMGSMKHLAIITNKILIQGERSRNKRITEEDIT